MARGPILLDAAMGTRLVARGLDLTRDDPSLWVIDRPEVVLEIHALDVLAGSDALLTDTFGANPAWLERFGRSVDAPRINRQATELARLAAGPSRFVIGSIGPTSSGCSPALVEQAGSLVEGGVDALLLETHRFDQAEAALGLLAEFSVPILVSLFAWPEPVGDPAKRLNDLGAASIGANCLVGMGSALILARKLHAAIDGPLFIKPSAGLPGSLGEFPQMFGDALPDLLQCGVRLVGGCCGTTDAHVSALRHRLDTRTENPPPTLTDGQ